VTWQKYRPVGYMGSDINLLTLFVCVGLNLLPDIFNHELREWTNSANYFENIDKNIRVIRLFAPFVIKI
jgi:hypothetical protein